MVSVSAAFFCEAEAGVRRFPKGGAERVRGIAERVFPVAYVSADAIEATGPAVPDACGLIPDRLAPVPTTPAR